MGNIEITSASSKELFKQFEKLNKIAPKTTLKWLRAIGEEMVNIAQDKLKSDKHIITARLRNSITTWFHGSGNKPYTFDGGTEGNNTSPIPLEETEVAVGTRVNYAEGIERLDSFVGYSANNIKGNRTDALLRKAAKEIEREASK